MLVGSSKNAVDGEIYDGILWRNRIYSLSPETSKATAKKVCPR